jgi:hypothetical protein
MRAVELLALKTMAGLIHRVEYVCLKSRPPDAELLNQVYDWCVTFDEACWFSSRSRLIIAAYRKEKRLNVPNFK